MVSRETRDMGIDNTAVLIDFERTLTNHNLLMDLFTIKPLMATKALLEGLRHLSTEIIRKKSLKNVRFSLTLGIKKSYYSNLTDEQKRTLGSRIYQIDRRYGVEDLLRNLNKDGWDYTIVTSSDKKIAEGFLNDFVPSKNIIGTNGDYIVWNSQKEELAKQKKKEKKNLICIVDCEIDAGMCRYADVSFKVSSLLSLLFGGYKVYGHNVKGLYEVNSFFNFLHYTNKDSPLNGLNPCF